MPSGTLRIGVLAGEASGDILGSRVLVLDSRPHIGGNCYDFVDQKTGILRNQYGSHLFHTDIERVWRYVTGNPAAPPWDKWYHMKYGLINGTYVPIPANIMTVNRLFGTDIQTEKEMEAWLGSVQVPCPKSGCRNGEEMAKSRVGDALYKAHRRVRQASRIGVRSLRVEPHLPGDVLGAFVYLPAGGDA